jgi:hypothetical protein
MSSDDPVVGQVVRRVLTKAIGDAEYRRMLLANPDGLVRFELARAGGPVPDIRFEAVEETETRWVLRVPVSRSERRVQEVLRPVFEFVDSAGEGELDRFVRAPRKKLEELLGIELDKDTEVVVRIESEGQRVLVIPPDEFGPLTTDSDLTAHAKKIKLCPKGVTVDLCPEDVTIVDICPADCTFTARCDCTISCTSTGPFPTIPGDSASDASSQDSLKKLSGLLDD